VSAGGTGTYAVNTWANEIQAGSYALMDTAYAAAGAPVRAGAHGAGRGGQHQRAGLGGRRPRAEVAGHGPRQPDDPGRAGLVLLRRAHHVLRRGGAAAGVGDLVRAAPAHVDPTVALHERMHLVDGDEVVETWEVDLRGW
jgi:D-serine deaminase-like pyridoxal phosphate-dependent protein